jgi:DNA-binding LytR/AlgR family response regulator
MKKSQDCFNIGLALLSADFRVIGMNKYAREVLGPSVKNLGKSVFFYHPRKSYPKIEYLMRKSCEPTPDMPVAMIIDVSNKVLMINLCRLDMSKGSTESFFAMTFIDVTEQTEAKMNPNSGMVELKKFPVCYKDSFLFLDASSIYFIRSDGNYCKIFAEKRSYYLHLTLKNILKRYAGLHLFRVHKCFIANLQHVQKIKRIEKGQSILFFNNENIPSIPVARRRIRALKKALAS